MQFTILLAWILKKKKKKNYTLLLKGLFGQLDEGPQKQELWTVLNTINFGTKLEEEFHLSQ